MTNAWKIDEATPRPWYVRRGYDTNDAVGIGAHSKGAAGGWVGLHVAELPVGEATNANAALIVRAVNAHPNLLSVLKQIEDFSSDPTSVSLARAAREYVGALP